jgi:hypothetical protein
MRAKYFLAREAAVNLPDCMAACNWEIVISSSSQCLGRELGEARTEVDKAGTASVAAPAMLAVRKKSRRFTPVKGAFFLRV